MCRDVAEYDRLNNGYFGRLDCLIQSPFLLLAFRWPRCLSVVSHVLREAGFDSLPTSRIPTISDRHLMQVHRTSPLAQGSLS